MAWKYILFDLDGTLTDSSEGIMKCVKYALEAATVSVPSEDDLLGFIGPPLVESFQKITGMDYEGAVQATQKYRERYSVKGLYENRLYNGIDKVLKQLQEAGIKIALATSKPEVYSVKILDFFNIFQYFDEVVGSTLDGKRNTKTAVIQEVFSRMNISEDEKGQVIIVGDRKHDIIGAKETHIKSCGVYYGFAPANELEEYGADYIVHEVEELLSVLLP